MTVLTCGFGAHQRRELIDSQWLAERPPQICPRTPPFRVTKERERKREREFVNWALIPFPLPR